MNRGELYADDEKRKRTNRIQKRRYRENTGSHYGRHEWTEAEENMVLQHAVPDRDLAARLGVSVQAIAVKRNRLAPRG